MRRIKGRFVCEICGILRPGWARATCRFCSLLICDYCLLSQAKIGHVEAEHGHAIRGR